MRAPVGDAADWLGPERPGQGAKTDTAKGCRLAAVPLEKGPPGGGKYMMDTPAPHVLSSGLVSVARKTLTQGKGADTDVPTAGVL